jgi:hypothetical protein
MKSIVDSLVEKLDLIEAEDKMSDTDTLSLEIDKARSISVMANRAYFDAKKAGIDPEELKKLSDELDRTLEVLRRLQLDYLAKTQ